VNDKPTPPLETLEAMLKRLHMKYNSISAALTMEPETRKDMAALLNECVKLLGDLAGARQTLIALCKMAPNGVVDVPYVIVAGIHPDDVLHATNEDVRIEGIPEPMKVKRFRVGLRSVVSAMPKVN